jgi:protein transport protein SEC61 subunit alpha
LPLLSRAAQGTYPIKLFYTSNIPIIILSAMVSNLYLFSQVLFRRYGGNILVQLLGRWKELEGGGSGESKPWFSLDEHSRGRA